MFEAAELGQKISKQQFDEREQSLHTELLRSQFLLQDKKIPVVIVISGVEGAGRGEVVNRLNKWLDVRGLQTHTFWDITDEDTQRPYYWRFWRAMPKAGSIAIMFGSWYRQHVIDRMREHINQEEYESRLRRIADFEKLLTDDGAVVVKFWFHLTQKEQKKRLKKDRENGRILSPDQKRFADHYDQILDHAERAIRATDAGSSPWHIVESTDRHYRDLTTGELLLDAFNARLEAEASNPVTAPPSSRALPTAPVTILDQIDLSQKLTGEYQKKLKERQQRLWNLAWRAHAKRMNTVVVIEGWDAAGKGSALRRITQAIDARLYRSMSVSAPTDEERDHHYLWRFWRQIPRAGHMTFYDRSWYGRVLVERIEGFAQEEEWKRAYHEINNFEEQLVEHGIVLLKFWIHISNDEQLRRFKERERVERKRHKITAEDWRNREKWDEYAAAVNDMVARTSSGHAPWTLVAGNDKKHARVHVLETMCKKLETALQSADSKR